MNHNSKPAHKTVEKLLTCWILASTAWYLHEFLPAFLPLFRGLLRRLWH
jgi:hypothetical protein